MNCIHKSDKTIEVIKPKIIIINNARHPVIIFIPSFIDETIIVLLSASIFEIEMLFIFSNPLKDSTKLIGKSTSIFVI